MARNQGKIQSQKMSTTAFQNYSEKDNSAISFNLISMFQNTFYSMLSALPCPAGLNKSSWDSFCFYKALLGPHSAEEFTIGCVAVLSIAKVIEMIEFYLFMMQVWCKRMQASNFLCMHRYSFTVEGDKKISNNLYGDSRHPWTVLM